MELLQQHRYSSTPEVIEVTLAEFTVATENSEAPITPLLTEPEYVEESVEEKKPRIFMCPVCDRPFKTRGSVYKHVRLAHHTRCSAVKKNGTVRCQEIGCDEFVHSIEQLRQHLEEVHNMQFEMQTMLFGSYEEFLTWKSQMELQTKSSFFKIRGDKKIREGHVEKYWCNRSGFYCSTKQKRFRDRPTCKIGGHCTATLTVHVGKVVTVDHCKTHYKHDIRLEHLPIPPHVLTDIANDLQKGVEVSTILDNHKSRIGIEETNRSHLITRKDIYNVEQRLRSLVRHKKECKVCPTSDPNGVKCKRSRLVARYIQPEESNDNALEPDDPPTAPALSVQTEEILHAIGYRDDDPIEKKKEHIELLLWNVREKAMDCDNSNALSSVTKSLAANLYELHYPAGIRSAPSPTVEQEPCSELDVIDTTVPTTIRQLPVTIHSEASPTTTYELHFPDGVSSEILPKIVEIKSQNVTAMKVNPDRTYEDTQAAADFLGFVQNIETNDDHTYIYDHAYIVGT